MRCPTGCCASSPAARAATAPIASLPHDAVLVARSMGPADLLDYDRSRLRGLVLEDSGRQSHVAIVARALGIPAIGDARGVIERVDQGNPIIVDAESGEVHIRPQHRRHRGLPRQGPLPRAAPAQVSRAARHARRHQGRPAHRAAHQCGAGDGRPASGGVGRRRHRPVPHRAAVHGLGDAAAPGAADPDVPRDPRGGRRQARGVPHPRCRRRQGAALPAPAGGGEPGARLARHPPFARPPGAAAHAGARAAAGRRRPASCACCCRW